ncbi:Uncharacterized protein C18orf1 [Anas platyrhynchos]|uniref:Uncharacterized protein C18orf1 n=1 Tax=Anas platyrhynchos TaxID=8839 RepID=R0L2K1_ANAPL|nr:Uncharacterized protein C18orf1 [Anas platyrhynchos]
MVNISKSAVPGCTAPCKPAGGARLKQTAKNIINFNLSVQKSGCSWVRAADDDGAVPPWLAEGPAQECKFTCASGKCLYLGSLICNQQNDCGDNSDEENCLLVTEHPPPGIFSCEYLLFVWVSELGTPKENSVFHYGSLLTKELMATSANAKNNTVDLQNLSAVSIGNDSAVFPVDSDIPEEGTVPTGQRFASWNHYVANLLFFVAVVLNKGGQCVGSHGKCEPEVPKH